jgi:hypothetical protein
VLSASSNSVSVLIRALQASNRVQILSRPQIRTLDNQSAYIQVGQRVPRVSSTSTTQGFQSSNIVLENVGLIVGVTPRISPDGMVIMEVDAEKSNIGSESQGIPISIGPDGSVVRSPRVDTTQAQATVSAASGETIVLGGLITNSTEELSRRVPFLSDIPVLGRLFRYDGVQDRRTELLIILTPHVILTPEDSERIKQAEVARMSWCAAQVYDLYEDIGYIGEPVLPSLETQIGAEVIYPDRDPRGAAPVLEEPAESTPNPPDQLPLLNQPEPFPQSDEAPDYREPLGPPPPPRGGRRRDPIDAGSSKATYETPVDESEGIRRLPPG